MARNTSLSFVEQVRRWVIRDLKAFVSQEDSQQVFCDVSPHAAGPGVKYGSNVDIRGLDRLVVRGIGYLTRTLTPDRDLALAQL